MERLTCAYCFAELTHPFTACGHTPPTLLCPHCGRCACDLPAERRAAYQTRMEREETLLERIWRTGTPAALLDGYDLRGAALERLQEESGVRLRVLGVADHRAYVWCSETRPGLRKKILTALVRDGHYVGAVRLRQVPWQAPARGLSEPFLYVRGSSAVRFDGTRVDLDEVDRDRVQPFLDRDHAMAGWSPVRHRLHVSADAIPQWPAVLTSRFLYHDLRLLRTWLETVAVVALVPADREASAWHRIARLAEDLGFPVETEGPEHRATSLWFLRFRVPPSGRLQYRIDTPASPEGTPFHYALDYTPRACGDEACSACTRFHLQVVLQRMEEDTAPS